MEIPCFKCQLLNAGRRDFSQWIENSLGSSLSWGKEGKRSNGRITVILIDSSSLLALYVYFFCDFFSPFYFLPDSCNPSARSLDNGIQQKLQEEILLQQNDQCSDIQPPSWSHRTLSVSRSQSWGCGRVSVCECVCVCAPGYLEGSSGVLCPCSRLQCKRSWSPAGCAAGASTFSDFQETGDVESWILQLMAMNNNHPTTLFRCLQQSTSYWTSSTWGSRNWAQQL